MNCPYCTKETTIESLQGMVGLCVRYQCICCQLFFLTTELRGAKECSTDSKLFYTYDAEPFYMPEDDKEGGL